MVAVAYKRLSFNIGSIAIYRSLKRENLGVLDKWSLMGVGPA